MKKIFTLLASLLMYSAVWAQSPILSEGGVNYYVLDEDAKTAVASGTDAISGDLVIRSKVGEYTVTKMLPLSGRVGLTGISIPATITDIEYGTFQSCTSLTKIVVDADNQNYTSSVNGIEYNALMSKDGTIFYSGCKTSVIPPSVTTIIQYAFLGCTGLTSIVIPMNVTSIEKDAFYGCTDMTDVYCWANPSNLTWTDYYCNDFKADKGTTCHVSVNYLSTYQEKWRTGNTSQLGNDVNVTFVNDLAEWVSESNCYKKDDVNYYLNSDGLTAYVGSSSDATGDITIRSEVGGGYPVTSIGEDAFYNCYDLTSIIIPETIISIGEDAFSGCI